MNNEERDDITTVDKVIAVGTIVVLGIGVVTILEDATDGVIKVCKKIKRRIIKDKNIEM